MDSVRLQLVNKLASWQRLPVRQRQTTVVVAAAVAFVDARVFLAVVVARQLLVPIENEPKDPSWLLQSFPVAKELPDKIPKEG